MEENREKKKAALGETMEEALYKKLTEGGLPKHVYETEELGEGMAIIREVIAGWWKPRYILNRDRKTAFEFMSCGQSLRTVKIEDIEWDTLRNLPEEVIRRAMARFAIFPTFVGSFRNGVARVRWQINPDGRYYRDDDGFGMTCDEEVEMQGYINKEGKVVGKFRLLGESDKDVDYRKMAEEEEARHRGKSED